MANKEIAFLPQRACSLRFNKRNSGIKRATCPAHASAAQEASASTAAIDSISTSAHASKEPLLLRAARGEAVERTPVWLMRQAGRYMSAFRKFSNHVPFRERSETPDIAFELSMQPYRAFQTDGVIMFSDILTPFPAVGVEFDIVKGKGPMIKNPIRTFDDAVRLANAEFDPRQSLSFVAELLDRLKTELWSSPAALLGFVGAPFTLAAYAIEGVSSKVLVETKKMMYGNNSHGTEALDMVLTAFADVAGAYAVFQIDHGAQIVQFFDSWAHHLSASQYKQFALPAALRAIQHVRKERPHVPIVFFANGCGGKLEDISAVLSDCIDVLQLDWSVSMADARQLLGSGLVLQGNIDPAILLTGSENSIRRAVQDCARDAGPGKHILNLGHGVIKETPEEAVAIFCDEARKLQYPQ